ncbi:MAG: class II D-tagatose-bisphosphate aldolase, non-catalytic subunit [Eubacteriales bacterium]|nr:class II D-tagatose-bisphosphate aldolase, non-catalytic subunit [Eubacteriales bacterium]
MKDTMRELIVRRQRGENCGIPSYCTANPIVLEACLELHKKLDAPILIEATANQVNQFGGYTGMRPADFRDMVFSAADKVGYPRDMIVLGGDHLGPLTWVNLSEEEAMANSRELVREFVLAGFKKIHLDTSMKLSSDDKDAPLSDDTIARRGAELYAVCEEAYQELRKADPDEQRPTFIIGSEVPIPGGAQAEEDSISVTKPEALNETLAAYRRAFESVGRGDAFENIIGVVVQPGVEFGDDGYFRYCPENAEKLVAETKKHKSIVLEGHSTDYQPSEALKEMVRDGIAILKVGPALTYALREGLFALSMMEKELVGSGRVDFPQVLENAMMNDPSKWVKHYHGDEKQQALCRRYSYSDRCRYYLTVPEVSAAIEALLENMSGIEIPMNMLHQYMPVQYARIIRGHLENSARELVKDYVAELALDYCYAVGFTEDIPNIHY